MIMSLSFVRCVRLVRQWPNRYTETKVAKDVHVGNSTRRRVQGEQLLTEEWREE